MPEKPNPDGIEVHWSGLVVVICACEQEITLTKPGFVVECPRCDRRYRLKAEVQLSEDPAP